MSEHPAPDDGPEASRPRAIVAGHGEFAAGLVSAVEQITGRGAELIPLAVPRLSSEDIERLFRARMDEFDVHVIFTDLQAGSCTMAARRLMRGKDDALLVCGTNLPILLDFVMSDTTNPVQAALHAVERGRGAIAAIGPAGPKT